jgi:hypothetical protein
MDSTEPDYEMEDETTRPARLALFAWLNWQDLLERGQRRAGLHGPGCVVVPWQDVLAHEVAFRGNSPLPMFSFWYLDLSGYGPEIAEAISSVKPESGFVLAAAGAELTRNMRAATWDANSSGAPAQVTARGRIAWQHFSECPAAPPGTKLAHAQGPGYN